MLPKKRYSVENIRNKIKETGGLHIICCRVSIGINSKLEIEQ